MGPGASILLRHRLTENQIMDLDGWIASISKDIESRPCNWGPIILQDSIEVAGQNLLTQGSGGFWLSVLNMDLSPYDPLHDKAPQMSLSLDTVYEIEQFQEHLGYYPEVQIVVSTGSKQAINHQIVGFLTLDLAGRFGALIKMGAIRPPSHFEARHQRLLRKEPWRKFEEIDGYVRPMPGRVINIYFNPGSEHVGVTHVVDVEFFQNWLHHDHFSM